MMRKLCEGHTFNDQFEVKENAKHKRSLRATRGSETEMKALDIRF